MKASMFQMTCVILVSACLVHAGEECCPADHAGVKAAGAGEPVLPQGHPPVDGQVGAAMPEGHPPIGPAAAMQPAVGTLMVKVVQGTRDADPIGAGVINVELYNRGKAVEKLTAAVDEKGNATFEGVRIPGSAQPMATFEYAGILFRAVGEPLTAAKPDQILRLVVFEATEEAPAWRILMRHLMLHPTPEGLHVMEIVAVENPGDRAWKTPVAQADQGHAQSGPTVVLPLPAGAADVQLGDGFDACCTTVEAGSISHGMPLLPGTSRFRYSYTLKASDGSYAIDMTSSAPVARLSVFVPDDGSAVECNGLNQGQTMDSGAHGKVRMYMAQDLAAGAKASLSISPAAKASAPAAEPTSQSKPGAPVSAKAVAGVGIAALVAGAALVVLRKPQKSAGH